MKNLTSQCCELCWLTRGEEEIYLLYLSTHQKGIYLLMEMMDLNCSFLETTFHFYYKKIPMSEIEKQFVHLHDCSVLSSKHVASRNMCLLC